VLSFEKTQSIFLSWFPGSETPSHDVAKHSHDTQAEWATDNHLCACLLTLFQQPISNPKMNSIRKQISGQFASITLRVKRYNTRGQVRNGLQRIRAEILSLLVTQVVTNTLTIMGFPERSAILAQNSVALHRLITQWITCCTFQGH